MKKSLVLVLAILMVCSSVFAGGAKEETSVPATGNAALTGKVMIYTSMYEDIIEAVDDKLETVFPNLDVEFFYGGTGILQSKIAAEATSGNLGCDMLMVAEPSYAMELKQDGLLAKIPYGETDKLAFAYDPDGYWYPVRISVMVLAYNPEKYQKSQIPTSFKAFASDPRVTDAISMGNPLTSGTTLASASALVDKYGYGYFDELGKQKVKVESGSVALTKLNTGECKEIMVLEESVLQKRQMDESKLEVIYPDDGSIVCVSPIMSIAEEKSKNKNMKACEALTAWFLSSEGQDAIVDGWMHSVRKDYTRSPYDGRSISEISKTSMPIDWEKTIANREEIRTKFQDAVLTKR